MEQSRISVQNSWMSMKDQRIIMKLTMITVMTMKQHKFNGKLNKALSLCWVEI